MVFVSAAVFLHGALPFDGDPNSSSQECRERNKKLPKKFAKQCLQLYEGTCKAADELVSMNPDVIILDSPHGFILSDSVAVYASTSAEGSGEWLGKWTDFKVNLDLDLDLSKQLVGHFRDDGIKAEGLVAAASSLPMVLKWGEAIPAWYLMQAFKNQKKNAKFIIITRPRPGPLNCIDGLHVKVGESLSKFIDSTDLRVAVAISGDLSHTYQTTVTDPMYLPDPRSNFTVQPELSPLFERLMEGWTKAVEDFSMSSNKTTLPENAIWDPTSARPWIEKAAELNPTIYSCGMGGFIALHGILAAQVQKGNQIKPHFITSCAPSYYGMMAATFMNV